MAWSQYWHKIISAIFTCYNGRWDPSYSPEGRRIAVIGTGASAVQAVPRLALQAERVTVGNTSPLDTSY